MKRTPLKRKAWMKRSGKSMERKKKPVQRTLDSGRVKTAQKAKTARKAVPERKKGIRAVSKKRQTWNQRYKAKKDAEKTYALTWDIGHRAIPLATSDTERHHPLGRIGCRILFYRHVTRAFHEWLHHNAAEARRLGFILPEMSGRESGPEQPDPFNILPEYRAYVKAHGLH